MSAAKLPRDVSRKRGRRHAAIMLAAGAAIFLFAVIYRNPADVILVAAFGLPLCGAGAVTWKMAYVPADAEAQQPLSHGSICSLLSAPAADLVVPPDMFTGVASMKLKLIVAVMAIAAAVFAQAQTPAGKKVTNADAQKVVAIISADKAKTKTYCDMSKIGDQIDQADQKKDNKKVDELSKQMDAMSQQLGPEYIALTDGLQGMDANSKEGKEIGAALDALDKLCGK